MVRRLAGNRAIAESTLNIPHPYEEGMAEEWIATHGPDYESGKSVHFAITHQETTELLGAISLMDVSIIHSHAELGYWIGQPSWGQGYCTEAARAVIGFAFEILELDRIHACHFSRNPASGRVMQKIGMKKEGIQKGHIKKWGRFEDLVLYGLMKYD